MDIAGVPTHLRMPDVVTLAAGGDEITAEQLAALVASMRASSTGPVILVGSHAGRLDRRQAGVGEARVPPHHEAAAAVGCALTQVGGQIDRVVAPGAGGRADLLSRLGRQAVDRAVAAGADPDTVRVTEVDELPMAYLPDDTVRVRARAIGDVRPRARTRRAAAMPAP